MRTLTPEEKTGDLISYRVLIVHRSAKLVAVGTVAAPSAAMVSERLIVWFPIDRYEVSVTIRPNAFELHAEAAKVLKHHPITQWRFAVAAKTKDLSLLGFIDCVSRDQAYAQVYRWFPESTHEVSIV